MPDTLGLLYEGILHFALIKAGRTPVKPKKAELSLSCRSLCEDSVQCSKTPYAPKLFIDPDVVLVGSNGLPTHIFYVTHWRNADNFQYKFWRTMAEIYEHKLYMPAIVSVNWIAEPLTHKEGLLKYLRDVCDYSFDLGISSDGVGPNQKALSEWVDRYRRSIDSVSIDNVVAVCENEWRKSAVFRSFMSPLVDHATNASSVSGSLPADELWSHQQRHCLQNRISAHPRAGFSSAYRTCIQALLILFGANPPPVGEINPRNLAGAYLNDEKAEILSKAAFRTKNKIPIPLLNRIVDAASKGRPRYELCQAVRIALRYCHPEVLDYCLKEYSSYCANHDTWADYVEVFSCSQEETRNFKEQWRVHEPSELLEKSILDGMPFLFTLLMESIGSSLNAFQKSVDPIFKKRTGLPLKKVSPFGDTGFHVFRAAIYGRHELLKTNGMKLGVVVRELIESSQIIFDAKVKVRQTFEECYLAALGSKMRTFLSKAPNPLLPFVRSRLDAGWKSASLQKTAVNSYAGGKTGKTDYDFVNGNHFVKIVTAQDGNEYHKTKELSGRIRSHLQLFPSHDRPVVGLILDGHWADEKIRALCLAGYASVQSIEEFFDRGIDF